MTKLVNILKKPLAVAGLLSVALASGVASADFNPKFYVGAGVDYAKYGISKDYDKTGVKSKGLGILVPILGVKFTQNFGLEAGYSFNKKIKDTIANEEYKVSNAYLDVMGYMPVADQVELVGGVGVGRLMVKAGKNVQLDDGEKLKNAFGFRVKAGVQYNINNDFGVRALVAYQSAGSKFKYSDGTSVKFVKNLTSIGLAATYTF